jgi:hypothetical protein
LERGLHSIPSDERKSVCHAQNYGRLKGILQGIEKVRLDGKKKGDRILEGNGSKCNFRLYSIRRSLTGTCNSCRRRAT